MKRSVCAVRGKRFTSECRAPLSVAIVLAFLTVLVRSGPCAETLRLTLGILPPYNAGGDAFGEPFDQHLALRLFERLRGTAAVPVLLNPGRLYNPADDDWLLDYGRSSGVQALLITNLLKTETPEKGDWTITVQSEVLNLASGTRSSPWKSSVALNKRDVDLDYRHWNTSLFRVSLGPSRVFEKQPLGKAMEEIAGQIRTETLERIQAMPASPAKENAAVPRGPCDVLVKVLYVSKHTASKSYTIFVDGQDESLNVKDGELHLREKSGTLLLQLAINDAPYKLPKQDFYQASSEVDCSKRQLSVNIGAAGEALLAWQ